MVRFTLKQLTVFCTIARTQNMTHAADTLNMSQSAASSALKELERQYDQPLFDRLGKRLRLNTAGTTLLPRAEALLEQADDLQQHLSGMPNRLPLKLGATLTIGNYLGITMMADFMRQHPGTHVTLDVANTTQITQKMLSGELDVGLVEGDVQHPDLVRHVWKTDELCVFCHRDHPLATKPELTDDELIDAHWILREPGSGTRQAFDRSMHNIQPALSVAMQLQHNEAIKRAVEANLGIGCLSHIVLKDAFERGSLVQLKTPSRDLTRQLYLLVHKRVHTRLALEKWIDYCLA